MWIRGMMCEAASVKRNERCTKFYLMYGQSSMHWWYALSCIKLAHFRYKAWFVCNNDRCARHLPQCSLTAGHQEVGQKDEGEHSHGRRHCDPWWPFQLEPRQLKHEEGKTVHKIQHFDVNSSSSSSAPTTQTRSPDLSFRSLPLAANLNPYESRLAIGSQSNQWSVSTRLHAMIMCLIVFIVCFKVVVIYGCLYSRWRTAESRQVISVYTDSVKQRQVTITKIDLRAYGNQEYIFKCILLT